MPSDLQMRQRQPGRAGAGVALTNQPAHDSTTAGADLFLGRLDGVRRAGKGWIARCPAHEDRSASLSVAVGDDGRTLLHCFAGCPAADVVAAVGLTIADLFPARRASQSPEQRRELRDRARQAQWKAALGVLDREATVVEIAGTYALRGEVLTAADRDRLTAALQRIASAKAVLSDG